MRRRIFIGLCILLIVGIILAVVFINLFKDKQTTELAKNIVSVSEGYLDDEGEEYQTITEYLNYLYSHITDEENLKDKTEVQNYKNAYDAFIVATDFFRREILYTSYSGVYKSNIKSIKKALSGGQNAANSLKDFVIDSREKAPTSVFWNVNSWEKGETYMKKLYTQTTRAISLISAIYKDCVDSKLKNNDFSTLILNQFNALNNDLTQNISDEANKGQALLNFANKYLSADQAKSIIGYIYNTDLQKSVKDILEKGETSDYYDDFVAGNIFGKEAV